MNKNFLISTMAVAALTGAANASPTTIDSIQCAMADADDLNATVRYTETASGRRLEYRFSFRDGKYASSSLRDMAGASVAAGSITNTTRPVVTFGSTWTTTTYSNLVSTLGDASVQDELAACAAPATSQANYSKWPMSTCPIFVFIWDEGLLEHLCGWLDPSP